MQLPSASTESRNLRNRHGSDNREVNFAPEEDPVSKESLRVHQSSPTESVETTLSYSSNAFSVTHEDGGSHAKDPTNERSEIDAVISFLTVLGNFFVSETVHTRSESFRSVNRFRLCMLFVLVLCLVLVICGGMHSMLHGMHTFYSTTTSISLLLQKSSTELPIAAAVCTHHRSGTVLFQAVGEKLCEEFLMDYERVEEPFRLEKPYLTQRLLYQHYYNATEKLIVGMHGFSENCPGGPVVGDYCNFFDSRCWLSACTVQKQPQDKVLPIAHIVRHPVEVLVSAYLYHQQDPPPEEWLAEPKPDALTILPEEVQDQYNSVPYYKVLQQLPPELGLRVEYTVEMDDLFRMARNYRDLKECRFALNVKFEEVQANYSPSMRQILGHLGLRQRFGEAEVMEIASKLDLSAMTKKIRNAYQVDMHVTEGKHDKQALRQVLANDQEMHSVLEELASVLEYPTVLKLQSLLNKTLS